MCKFPPQVYFKQDKEVFEYDIGMPIEIGGFPTVCISCHDYASVNPLKTTCSHDHHELIVEHGLTSNWATFDGHLMVR